MRKIRYIILVREWDKCFWCEHHWGCKCLLHCHRVEGLLANQSCTCSCPSSQHSVRGNDNHWSFVGVDAVQPACCSCWSFIWEDQRRCHMLNRRDRSWCIILCVPSVSACIFDRSNFLLYSLRTVDCSKGAIAVSLGQKVVLSFNGYWGKRSE